MSRYYALWSDRFQRHHWAGPFPTNVVAAEHMATKDTSNGRLVTTGIPETAAELNRRRWAEGVGSMLAELAEQRFL